MPRASTSPDTRRGLKVSTVVKSYSGTVVLNGVSLTVAPGEVVGLVGHNGAGKSTLMRCISGATRPDAGSVEVDGQSVRPGETSASIGAGIATVYQELSLLPNLTVAENVFLGNEIRRGGLRAKQLMHRATQALLKEFDLDLDPQVEVSQIPVAARQLLEVAIATRRQARYILLDEPTTSLEGDQVDRFLESVRGLAARGLGIVLVDHKLEELYAVCDRIVALVDGAVRIDAAVAEVPREDVVEAIAGDADAMLSHDRAADESRSVPMAVRPAEASVMVRTRHLRTNTLADVSLLAARGRILGIYGLVGAGRTELLHALIGLEPVVSGELELDGRRYRPRGPHDAMKHRVVYVTEERKADGIIPQLDSVKNLMLPVLRSHQRFGLLGHRALARVADEHMNALRVRGARQNPIEQLSGGNQQKVVIGRAIVQQPQVLLLDEPTKGVDLGVKAQIHTLVRSLAHEQGMTILLVSSEEEEIVEVADDVVVMSEGRCDGRLIDPEHLSAAGLRRIAWSAA